MTTTAFRSRFSAADRLSMMRNYEVRPVWTGDDRFVYRRSAAEGFEFVEVDARAGTSQAAFDHAIVAANLGAALEKPVAPGALPFEQFEFVDDRAAIRVIIAGAAWRCSLAADGGCTALPALMVDGCPGVASPDGRWLAYRRNGNLWLHPRDGSGDFALTDDAVPDCSYAGSTGNNCSPVTLQIHGITLPPNLRWSPDSKRIFTHRIDERGVKLLSLLQAVPADGSARAKTWNYRYAMPGDPCAMLEHLVFEIATRTRTAVDTAPRPLTFVSPIEMNLVWWGAGGDVVYFVDRAPWNKTMTLRAIDPVTGAVRAVVSESAEPYIEPNLITGPPMIAVTGSGDVIWISRRDGFPHLYRHDLATGALCNAITRGDFTVRAIVRIDEKAQRLWFLASGREPGDPYLMHVYTVGLDGSDLRHLTPEDAEHAIPPTPPMLPDPLGLGDRLSAVSPRGDWFVDTFSRADLLPVSVLRRADGTIVQTLERGEFIDLDMPADRFPEPFEVLAADGVTKIYGTLFRPLDFDPAKSYPPKSFPIVDSIYPGPQTRRVRKAFVDSIFDGFFQFDTAQAGMITVTIDGRGTPDRSNDFLAQSYGRLDNAGMLEDHIAAIRQLAERYPYIDATRVGIYGGSGGGYATARAMFSHGDFFKAGVSICGNHDQRGYLATWAESYNGPDNEAGLDAATNARIAHQLTGKLFLIHGEMDDNVHPALTMQVVDALIKADKDFELLIVPNANHSVGTPYVTRRTIAFLARELRA